MKLLFTTIVCVLASYSFSQTITGKYLKDSHSGCRIWDHNYIPKDSVIWTGTCAGKYADGNGTAIWRRNSKEIGRYSGTVKRGKPNGKGKYLIPDNYTLEGIFIDGLLQGTGQINDDGYLMHGSFVNNVLQGKGKVTFNNGNSIEGHFVDGQFVNLDASYLPLLKRSSTATFSKDIYRQNETPDSLYYYTVSPSGAANGALVLMPSSGETAKNVICCNKELIQSAADHHILTIVLSINNGNIDGDKTTLSFLNKTFKEVTAAYQLPKDKFIVAGLSGGGMLALRYTEIAREDSSKTFIIPAAVIGIDPPVDMAGLYNRSKRFALMLDGKPNLSAGKQAGLNEAKSIVNSFNSSFNGPPEKYPEPYIKCSMYSLSQKDGGNAKYLLNVPVRLYCDPDILWNLKERNRDYYDMNAADLSAMINFLNLGGNSQAELIPAVGKGYRLDGTRHPHSWSILAPTDCIDWILKIVQ